MVINRKNIPHFDGSIIGGGVTGSWVHSAKNVSRLAAEKNCNSEEEKVPCYKLWKIL